MAKIVEDGITFDDVLLIPAYSKFIPSQIDVGTLLTKNIRLNIPLMSAGMDTVTAAATSTVPTTKAVAMRAASTNATMKKTTKVAATAAKAITRAAAAATTRTSLSCPPRTTPAA